MPTGQQRQGAETGEEEKQPLEPARCGEKVQGPSPFLVILPRQPEGQDSLLGVHGGEILQADGEIDEQQGGNAAPEQGQGTRVEAEDLGQFRLQKEGRLHCSVRIFEPLHSK